MSTTFRPIYRDFSKPSAVKLLSFCFVSVLTLLGLAFPDIAAADLINSVSCASPGASLVTSTTSCQATGTHGYATALSTSVVSLSQAANNSADIQTDTDVFASLAGSHALTSYSTAQSNATVTINFDTAGPVQSGYLKLDFANSAWNVPSFGSANELLTIGSYSVAPAGQNLTSVFIPIQLGSAFLFSYSQNLTGNGDAASGAASGAVHSDISLQAYAADQVTPVLLFDPPAASPTIATPEPDSFSLVTIAIFGALLLLRRAHKSSE